MAEPNAKTTFLLCFSEQSDHQTESRISFCWTPADDGRPATYSIAIDLARVSVQLPSPLPGGQPVQGLVDVHEQLSLSPEDLRALRQWLKTYAPAESARGD